MYKCNNCNIVFEEPTVKEFTEQHEAWGRKFTETYTESYCPKCGDEDFEEVAMDFYDAWFKCLDCGAEFDYFALNMQVGHECCPECRSLNYEEIENEDKEVS